MASTIHFTSAETVTIRPDAKGVIDQLGQGKTTRFELVVAPVFEVYVASDEVAYVAQIPTAEAIAAWADEVRRD